MFIEINMKDALTNHVCYVLKFKDGQIMHVGITPWAQLCSFNDLPQTIEKGDIDLYLTVLDQDVDRIKLINRAVTYCHEHNLPMLRDRLNEQFVSWSRNKKGREIICVETGEKFPSATATARAHNLTYGALLKHLQKEKSYNTVKAKTYNYV